jgi:nickel/cobalt transporter (NicO) family protein
MTRFRASLLVALCLLAAWPAYAHPIAKRAYERTVAVRITETGAVVDYQLDLDEATAELDLLAVRDKSDLADLRTRDDVRNAFVRAYAPVIANYMGAELDGDPVDFVCTAQSFEIIDHMRCRFTFRGDWKLKADGLHQFKFLDGNYESEAGALWLSLTGDETVSLSDITQPSEKVQARQNTAPAPGDREKLRNASATISVTPQETRRSFHMATQAAALVGLSADGPVSLLPLLHDLSVELPAPEAADSASPNQSWLSLERLLDSQQGFWLLLFMAVGFGAAHALTPGHGKTLVAAYLVGERGTVGHAIFLGLVTTLTHTWAVVALAAVFYFLPTLPRDRVQFILGAGGGLLVAGMGIWLLFRRLTGQADHVHLGGHGHHHHGEHHHHHHRGADHYHDEHGHTHPLPNASTDVGWWRLVILGVSGGIVPCWDAILMLVFAVITGRLWLGLPLLVAFSSGLAGVLVLIGVLVVKAKGFAGSRFGESRLFRMLPVASAAAVTVLGLWLCYESTRPPTEPAKSVAVKQ